VVRREEVAGLAIECAPGGRKGFSGPRPGTIEAVELASTAVGSLFCVCGERLANAKIVGTFPGNRTAATASIFLAAAPVRTALVASCRVSNGCAIRLNPRMLYADGQVVSWAIKKQEQRGLFEDINDHAGTHPVLVVTADGVVGGFVGFVIGYVGYRGGSLTQGCVYAAILGVLSTAIGLGIVLKVRGTFHDSGGSHAVASPSASPRPSATSHWPKSAGSLQFSRAGRLGFGLSFVGLAIALSGLVPHTLAMALVLVGGVFVGSTKFRRFP
jgi:hypothetical protein